jgi:hypothetical protein
MLMPLPGTHALARLGEVDGNSAGEGTFAEPLRSFANIHYGKIHHFLMGKSTMKKSSIVM